MDPVLAVRCVLSVDVFQQVLIGACAVVFCAGVMLGMVLEYIVGALAQPGPTARVH